MSTNSKMSESQDSNVFDESKGTQSKKKGKSRRSKGSSANSPKKTESELIPSSRKKLKTEDAAETSINEDSTNGKAKSLVDLVVETVAPQNVCYYFHFLYF
jgi:hypothetical protein